MAQIIDKVVNLCCADSTPFMKEEEEKPLPISAPVRKPATKAKTKPKPEEPAPKKEEEPVVSKKAEEAPEVPVVNVDFTGKMTKYNDFEWVDLPEDVKEAFTVLGHSEADFPHGWPESEGKWFSELSEEEQEAATTIGYDATSWNTFYEDKDWDDLPAEVQKAAEAAGFTKEMWDDDEWPACGDKYWNDMTDTERKAMMTLGWTKNEWD